MFFEREKYYQFIKSLELLNYLIYILLIILAITAGIILKNILYTIFFVFIAIIIANAITIRIRIKILEMQWKLDIYDKIIKMSK